MTSEKSYDTAQRLDKLISEGWIIPHTVQKSSDQNRAGTNLNDDSELSLTVPTPARYRLMAHILYKGGSGASAGHLNFSWNTNGSGSLRTAAHRWTTGSNWWVEHMVGSTTAVSQTDGLSNIHPLHIFGTWSVTSTGPTSTLAFQWCKNVVADGSTDTWVLQWSYMELQRFDDG